MSALHDTAERFADGDLVLVADERDRPTFVATSAETIDAGRLDELQRLGRGMVVLAIEDLIAERLELPDSGASARHPLGFAFTAPIDAAAGINGGWSARDRASTMRLAADPEAHAADLTIPGHVQPARVSEHRGDAVSAALELARLGGRSAAVAISAVLDGRGRPASLDDTCRNGELGRLPRVLSAELHNSRLARRVADEVVSCMLPTRTGSFRAIAYRGENCDGSSQPLGLIHGDPGAREWPLVHIHSGCLLGDAFGSLLCECRAVLDAAVAAILQERAGVVIYAKPDPAAFTTWAAIGSPTSRWRRHCCAAPASRRWSSSPLLRR